MRTKEYIGRLLLTDSVVKFPYDFLPDYYDYLCYRVTLLSSNNIDKRGYYYFDILFDESKQIKKIYRYFEEFIVNREIKRFPKCVEEEFEYILENVTQK